MKAETRPVIYRMDICFKSDDGEFYLNVPGRAREEFEAELGYGGDDHGIFGCIMEGTPQYDEAKREAGGNHALSLKLVELYRKYEKSGDAKADPCFLLYEILDDAFSAVEGKGE